jgi:hypothetical protein
MLEVKAGKRSLSSSLWYLSRWSLLLTSPTINRGSIMKAGLGWSFALWPCVALVARWASGLLDLLFDVATRRLLALVALAIIIPPVPRASSTGVTNLHSFTMVLRSRGHVRSVGHWMLPIELHEHALG